MSPSKVSSVKWDEFYNIINGQQRGGKDQHYGVNPSTGEKLWPVPIGSQKDVDEAVSVAQKAFESWRYVPIEERKQYLDKVKDILLQYSDDMTELLCAETGKPKQIAEMETKGGVMGWYNFQGYKSHPSSLKPCTDVLNQVRSPQHAEHSRGKDGR